jgi:hypothetical protein
MSGIKGLSPAEETTNGSALRIGIVHARWNKVVVDALVDGAVKTLKARGVKESAIVVQAVPGSFELPLATSKCVFSTLPAQRRTRRAMAHPNSFCQDDIWIADSGECHRK